MRRGKSPPIAGGRSVVDSLRAQAALHHACGAWERSGARQAGASPGPFPSSLSVPLRYPTLSCKLANGRAAVPRCPASLPEPRWHVLTSAAGMADDDSDEWGGQRDDGEVVGSCCPNCGASSVAFDESAGGEVCTACGELVAGQSFLRPEVGFDDAGVVGVRLHAGDDGTQAARRALGGVGSGAPRGIFRDRAGVSTSDAARRRAEQVRATELYEALATPHATPPRQLAASLHLPATTAAELGSLLQRVTEGRWGTGRWAELLAGACAYVVIRQNRFEQMRRAHPAQPAERTPRFAQACGHAA